MIIELVKGPACLGFETKLNVDKLGLKNVKKTKEGIIFTFMNKSVLIPWNNIVAIEE